ncbi:hypothetical protein LTR64_008653 [Lithohypha guttulata]|uniref:uncharacterized protein n=1 Tax=Lithohypha guttulata TaxID=1690604 RepID=UPI002DDE1531|nr:hypothetical protein LTR51_008740 [Lithohypha guttulata]
MDDLLRQTEELTINQPRLVSYHEERILEVLDGQLNDARYETWSGWETLIRPMIEDFCRQWTLPTRAVENFMALTKGNPHFPVILLRNPVKDHDAAGFEDMVNNCPTLRWLEDVLHARGLLLDDVVILDVCPLLSDFWLARNKHIAEEAIRDAYLVTETILLLLKPKLLISCQCATKGVGDFGLYASSFVERLGSTTSNAKQKLVMPFRHEGNEIYIAQAYHPRYFLGRECLDGDEREDLLKEIIGHFMAPFGKWKADVVRLLHMEAVILKLAKVMNEQRVIMNRMLKFMYKLEESFASMTISRPS